MDIPKFVLKVFIFFTLFLALQFGYAYFAITYKLPMLPEGVFGGLALLTVFSSTFVKKVWKTLFRPLVTFLVLTPAINKGLTGGAELLGIELPEVIKSNLYFITYSVAGFLSTFGFFIIKQILWGVAQIFIKPIRFFYKGLDGFFDSIEKGLFKKTKKKDKELELTLRQIDNIQGESHYERGVIFEKIIANAYNRLGYYAETTSEMRQKGTLPRCIQERGGSGEQGVDVVVKIPAHQAGNARGAIMAVQCKLYSKKVSNKAVQEIVAALPLYEADYGVVVTNSYFTKPAEELAQANGIVLVDREKLAELIENSKTMAA